MKNLAVRVLTRLLAPLLMPVALLRGLVSLFTFDTTYPPRPGTIDGAGIKHIDAFLKDPLMIRQRMRDITELDFVGDKILRGRASTPSGSVAYSQTESNLFSKGTPEIVAPGGVFPATTIELVNKIIEAIKKVGLATEVTRESVEELLWNPVDNAIFTLSNDQVQRFDLSVMAKIVATFGQIPTLAGSDWGTATDTGPVRQVLQAIANIKNRKRGFRPDTILLNYDKFVEWVGNEKVLAILARFTGGDASFTEDGTTIVLPGSNLRILSMPTDNIVTDPLVLDSLRFGAIVRKESDPADDDGVHVETAYFDTNHVSPDGHSEVYRISTRRERLPIIQEPEAAVRITGT